MKNFKQDLCFRIHSRYNIVLAVLAVLFLFACGAILYVPSTLDAEHSGVTVDKLNMGRNLYVNHCASCHNLYAPEKFSRKEWSKIMPKMQVKAKIDSQDATLIKVYVEGRSN